MKKNKKPIFTLGLMSGTSVDGIDACLLMTEDEKDHVLFHEQYAYPAILRAEILELIRSPEATLPNFTKIHYEIGEAFATAAAETIKIATRKKFLNHSARLLSIGSHGQTVYHDPLGRRTLQIGESSIIAEKTGVTTVSDLRTADTAAGGEGAPLLPYYHKRLFQSEASRGIAVHNLGGISNFTYFNKKEILALDTGPANCLLDGACSYFTKGVKQFDENGEIAKSGKIVPALLAFFMEAPGVKDFLRRPAPKSTGRELFSPKLLELAYKKFPQVKIEDFLRTLAQLTVNLAVLSYKKYVGKKPLRKIVLAGGGARNSLIMQLMQNEMPKVEFFSMEDFGYNSQALESQAFAYYSYLTLMGESITFATTTGVHSPAPICGKINPGRNWDFVRANIEL